MVQQNFQPAVHVVGRRLSGAVVAIFALIFLSACADSDESAEPQAASTTEATAAPAGDGVVDETSNLEFAVPEGAPAGFPDINVPFYVPSELVAAPDHGGDPFVLEFVTDADLGTVKSFIETHVVESAGWNGVSSSHEDQIATTEAQKDGYLLIVSVSPERVDEKKTSIFYTMRAQ